MFYITHFYFCCLYSDRLYKKPSGMGSLPVQPIETPTIHRALFKVGPPGPNKSVKFTVKI